jgi:hypothetical protein
VTDQAGDVVDNPIERLELLAGDDEAIASYLDQTEVTGPREREMLGELARTTTLADPTGFSPAHRRVAAARSPRRCAMPAACCSTSNGFRTTSSRPRASSRWRRSRHRRRSMFARRGPGLVGAAARTAVVVGTAGRVQHRQQQRYAAQAQEQAAPQPPVQESAPAAAAAEPDYMAELERLAQLKSQGIISEEEFEAKKKQILGI